MCVKLNLYNKVGYMDTVSLVSDLMKYGVSLDEATIRFLAKEAERLHLGIEQVYRSCLCGIDVEILLSHNEHVSFRPLNDDFSEFNVFIERPQAKHSCCAEWIKVRLENGNFALARIYSNTDSLLTYRIVVELTSESTCDEIVQILTK